ncbi:proton-conducting transporter membrane subunit [Nitratifractor salsuginis]|uniref:NADH/Ubiquinone/plastoquinone (Complex I) n=1 Tax=Nitratifractor salsuginis (strain DSM 16511 / JCM 12458 / E9I37-1) TaxID=749222 RepID=E6X224_NITSE|nr:proton-conducting transporter membrane subunit [Nitratifractor salsuginis]ADV47093.1 NADH/Ubiquinone/plastoquinone (complex I) [Nitratifractor salsuginis DSM 16511]
MPFAFHLDALSLLFVFLILLGALPNLFYSQGYLPHIERKAHYLIHYFGFILSMLGVVTAANALTFLLFWELMSLTSWQLILTEPEEKGTIPAARFYFFMTHFGFVFLLLFFLLVTDGNLELDFAQMQGVAAHFAYPTLLFFFLILGFLSKAGAVPLHVWLPYAHPAAPSPVSALMSGVMLKVAIYGMFRFMLDVLYPWPLEWGILILVIGALSSLVGVLYALSEHDIKALLANHSIENIGIILIGFGMGMIFDALQLGILSTFAFIAALFHTFNHMSFKSLLFMGAGSVLHETHTKNIEAYGGLIKSMPITALTFLLASVSISALPPTNGFLSEWMIFQSLLSSNTITNMSLKLAIPFAIFALALTGGLAIACFVKAYGITFLGLHRSANARHAKEVNGLMRFGMLAMAGVVIALMLFAPAFIHLFDRALVAEGKVGAYDAIFPFGVWHMHSVAVNGGVVSPLLLLISLLGVTLLLAWAYRMLGVKERLHRTWACGYRTGARTQYSATGFAGPIRRFFTWLYRPEEHLHKETLAGHESKFDASSYEVHVKPLFERSLYDGTAKLANRISYWIYRLAHFEQTRYAAMIFNLMLLVLFSYRIFAHEFSWATFALESVVMVISIKVLIIGEKR